MLTGKRILLIVTGGIAAYKTPDLVRRLRERGAAVRCVLTEGGARFVTPLSLSAVSGDKVYRDLFDLTDEQEMGHIQLSRDADVILVAPASADVLAKMAHGLATDLATTALLATDKPVIVAPAMNVRMWEHAATRANLRTLMDRGVTVIGPEDGDMACGEFGPGRMTEPLDIVAAVVAFFHGGRPLAGRHALVTSGPTHEPIDPVRYIANRSSGKQGHAIATALAALGARVTLVTGPVALKDPPGVATVHVETARDMLAACLEALPADIAVCAAAVADWRAADTAPEKMKKDGGPLSALALAENPDILAALAQPGPDRPALVVGFAAETETVVAHARAKLKKKGCDWICANDVSPETGTFGGDMNRVHLVTADGIEASEVEDWPALTKAQVGEKLARRIARHLAPAAAEDAGSSAE
ncbi:MAG: bifunctional phosphopantothenoylcysteine decarboxylase/phosphopantothenate--cysteine ligase CoaBC [Rhodospirillales bacterium CG15_BIG_FIL_POST_REV_8_21_14_020_66_15]|nr:MAG: bifunctional phosphopantothenoylcysteine decarboxylase/phosphopantothenate--cysteine ligase CoaBC [Rhodospirillales bacterium CG15_BIG_FIL_POST_REV_8_21_14_020_66_15]